MLTIVGVERPELGAIDHAILHPLHLHVVVHPQRPGVDGVGVATTFTAGGTAVATTTTAVDDVDELERIAAGGGAHVPVLV
jgi:hypothetical protein